MKVIDLLNKMANREKVPDIKIKIGNKEKRLHYIGNSKFMFDNCYIYIKTIIHKLDNDLNREIEIIEEDKEIEEISLKKKYNPTAGYESNIERLFEILDEDEEKINELIRYIKRKEGK